VHAGIAFEGLVGSARTYSGSLAAAVAFVLVVSPFETPLDRSRRSIPLHIPPGLSDRTPSLVRRTADDRPRILTSALDSQPSDE
jgi:hypothetical protein